MEKTFTHKKIISLQALRGFAALLVVLLHVSEGLKENYGNSFLAKMFSFGNSGVDIFFVISGFIMMYVHYNDVGNPKQWFTYISKRVWRVYPVYWIAFLFPLLIYMFQNRIGVDKEMTYLDVIASFLLLPQNNRTILIVSWTLVYEMMFYFLFSFLIFNKKVGFIVLGTWILMIFSFNIFSIDFPIKQFVDYRNLEFVLGIFVAVLLIKKQIIPLSRVWLLLGLILFSIGIILKMTTDENIGWIYALSAGLVIVSTAQINFNNENVLFKFFIFMGEASYSIYLIHVPITLATYKILMKFNFSFSEIAFVICLFNALFGGIIFYQLVEKNLINWKFNHGRNNKVVLSSNIISEERRAEG